jgi:transcriptional regulator with XRE-family HTH domain
MIPTGIPQIRPILLVFYKPLGMSHARLAAQLSVSQQQVALFESGEGRLFASHIYLLGRALRVPVDFFFGLSDARQNAAVPMMIFEPSKSPSPPIERTGTSNDGRLNPILFI